MHLEKVLSMKETIPEIIELERQIKTQKEIFKQLQQKIRTTPVVKRNFLTRIR